MSRAVGADTLLLSQDVHPDPDPEDYTESVTPYPSTTVREGRLQTPRHGERPCPAETESLPTTEDPISPSSYPTLCRRLVDPIRTRTHSFVGPDGLGDPKVPTNNGVVSRWLRLSMWTIQSVGGVETRFYTPCSFRE